MTTAIILTAMNIITLIMLKMIRDANSRTRRERLEMLKKIEDLSYATSKLSSGIVPICGVIKKLEERIMTLEKK